MNKRGPKPKQTIVTGWSSELAYSIGLITTDGSLSKDGRHIDLTSKDRDLLQTFSRCLKISHPISKKQSGSGKMYLRVQFSNVLFYQFLQSVGLFPNKTKTMDAIGVPDKFFFDFLRGHFDGDGTFYSYFDPRWPTSHMYYTCFLSASKNHIEWLRDTIRRMIHINGHLNKNRKGIYYLKYAKKESIPLLERMYWSDTVPCLLRKRRKVAKTLSEVYNLKT